MSDIKITLSISIGSDEKKKSFFSLVPNMDHNIMVEHDASGESMPRYWRSRDTEKWFVYTEAEEGRPLNRERWMSDKVVGKIYEKLMDLVFEEEVL